MRRDLALLTDEELFRLCRETRDPDVIRGAVELLAVRHTAGLVRFLGRYVSSRESAEDLAQEAFVRIYRHARGYRDIAKVKTWLYRIAHNLALNEIRDRKRKPALSLEAATRTQDGESASGLPDRSAPDPAQEAAGRDIRSRVRAAVDGLPEPYRGAVVLCDLEGFSYQEAAEVLETKVGTIRSRLFRGREQLSRVLEPLRARGAL